MAHSHIPRFPELEAHSQSSTSRSRLDFKGKKIRISLFTSPSLARIPTTTHARLYFPLPSERRNGIDLD